MNDNYLPILTGKHPELDLKFATDKKVRKGLKPMVSEDDAPELTQAFFDAADLYEGMKIKSFGNSVSNIPKAHLDDLSKINRPMKTLATIDADLYEKAPELAGPSFDKEAIFQEALKTYVRAEMEKRLADLPSRVAKKKDR